MALGDVQVGVPADAGDVEDDVTVPVLFRLGAFDLGVGWHDHPSAAVQGGCAYPELVVTNKREDLLVGDGVLVAHDDELLSVLHERRHILAEQRERRIGHDDVGFVQQLQAFLRPEVPRAVDAVAMQLRQFVLPGVQQVPDVVHIQPSVAGGVAEDVDDGLVRPAVSSRILVHVIVEQGRLVLAAGDGGARVAGGDELLQPEGVEVQGEVLEEVRLERVVAVAQDDLSFEMFPVVNELVLDVGHACVELVVLGLLGGR